MDLEKGAARRRSTFEFGDTGDLSPSRSLPPVRALAPSIAVARALRDASLQAAGRKSRLVSALNDLPVPSGQLLQEYFDLTLAEVKLAQGLARGSSLEEAARQLNIKMSTARTQLASIFAKTDSQRQGKLIAILSCIAHMS